ncbi:DUF4395 domain-containing protein [Spirosoma daeguense]
MKKEENSSPFSSLTVFPQGLDCPVDGVKMNENKARIVAFLVLLTAITYIATGFWPLFLFLLVDFALRAFDYGKFSPLARLSDWLIEQFNVQTRLVDQAPKRFAAGIGMVFSAVVLSLHFLAIPSVWVAGTLAVFASLESLAGFCAGCYVYTFLKRVRVIR